MVKRNKKKSKRVDKTTKKSGKQQLSGQSGQRVKLRRYAIWSISGLMVVVAAVIAWTVFQKVSHGSSESTSENQSQAAVSLPNTGNNSLVGQAYSGLDPDFAAYDYAGFRFHGKDNIPISVPIRHFVRGRYPICPALY